MNAEALKSPYPWFGGKKKVAPILWRGFGATVPNYVEPFAGSVATLLARPGGAGKIETINDVNRFVANFWRAVSADPAAVAHHADWPVNEADMHARHEWLIAWGTNPENHERMHSDADFFDAEVAGRWVWGQCMWIGGGWCAIGSGTNHKIPKLDGIGKGVHSNAGHKRPGLCGAGVGVHQMKPPRGRPDMTSAGQGVHLPSLGNDRGIHGVSAPPCDEWFRQLQTRLRRVRVACGDWKRVVSPSVLGKGKNVGGRRPCAVYLDPPYDVRMRSAGLYSDDAASLSAEAREWAIANGDDPELRIALSGYEGEHEMPSSWTVVEWKAARGYAGADNDNRSKERIWFSPHCLPVEQQRSLFEVSP